MRTFGCLEHSKRDSQPNRRPGPPHLQSLQLLFAGGLEGGSGATAKYLKGVRPTIMGETPRNNSSNFNQAYDPKTIGRIQVWF